MNTLYASEFAVQGKGKNANPDYMYVLEIYKLYLDILCTNISSMLIVQMIEIQNIFFSFRASRRNILSKQQVSNENVKLFYVYVLKV